MYLFDIPPSVRYVLSGNMAMCLSQLEWNYDFLEIYSGILGCEGASRVAQLTGTGEHQEVCKLLHITFGLLAGMQKTHLNEVKSLYLFIGYLFKESYEFDGLLSSLVFTADESLSGRGFILEISTAKLDPEGN